MTLFDDSEPDPETQLASSPLAERMRPRTLDEFVGQELLLGPGRPLRQAIEQDRIQSLILWGPPGTGKTTLVARQVSARGGTLRVVLDGDRVRLAGQAVTVLRGELVE